MELNSKLYLLVLYIGFLAPFFAPRPHMGNVVRMDLKLPSRLVHVLVIMASSYLKIGSYKNQG